jgi:hypothetical protein
MEKRCFTTEKKTKRNVGFLSTNAQIKKKEKKNKEKQSENCENIRPFSVSLANPELGSELLNLKK